MASALDIPSLIRAKRDGRALADADLRAFIAGVSDDSIPDYQIAAMLMAIFWRGLDDAEMASFADAMVHSGEILDLGSIDRPKVDKHSTGGVGDKISLPLAPAVAVCGAAVPMISGRGLGHTGGTLDKLESIPGFSVDLSSTELIRQLDRLGLVMIGQTEKLAPADRRLYALRDVTATVESVPLIASSIMSKKLAEGIDALVLDCKVGEGAFMKTLPDARALGQAIRAIGQAAGKRVSVLFTAMETPIGRCVGNALEVIESIEVLRGGGPADTRELTIRLGAEMLRLAGVVASEAEGIAALADALDSGRALERFGELIAAQGGDARVIDDVGRLPHAREEMVLTAPAPGVVTHIAAMDIALAALALGAGRMRKEDAVDPSVGIELAVVAGERVERGQLLARIRHNGRGSDRASQLARAAFTLARSEEGAPRDAGARKASSASRIIEVMR